MAYKTVSNEQLKVAYNNYCSNKIVDERFLDDNYKKMRTFLSNKYNQLKQDGYSKYQLDLELGLDFYIFLNEQYDFVPYLESDDSFWKYIAVFVIPDIVADRHGISHSEYFFKKNVRVYPYTLYWYINMSWQGSRETTFNILKNNTSDEILQIVERPSKIGINLDLNRGIMKRLSEIPRDQKYFYKDGKKITKFRVLLIKNTSKLSVTRPEIYERGIDGYIDMLFQDLI